MSIISPKRDDETLSSLNKGTSVDINQKSIDLLREHGITSEASLCTNQTRHDPLTKTIKNIGKNVD